MNVVAFLIFWTLPLLPFGGQVQSPPGADALGAEAHDLSVVVQPARDLSSPDDPGIASPGASLDEEEDSLEDLFFDTGLLLSSSWRSLERDHRSAFARSRRDLLRTSSLSHPLRC